MTSLEKIKKSSDLKKLPLEELDRFAEDIRQEVISAVSKCGGHLASNLGIVELTLALHYVFDIPDDQIVWDVGHQSYIHKILTGRRNKLSTIRQKGGISGFPRRDESQADAFGTGHASTAISAALGLATARDLQGKKNKVIAVVGDGALTGGLAYEGLNNAGASKKDILVVLNDNEMSISRNVGAISKYLTNIMTDKRFNKLRDDIWELTGRFKRRDKIRAIVSDMEDSIKGFFVPGYLFDKLGFRYLGPIDGHDMPLLVKTLRQIKELTGPILLHIMTRKGKGFQLAEADATRFHGIGAFDKITGKLNSKSSLPSYTGVFGESMLEIGRKYNNVVAVTAAMSAGTGLTKFAEEFPERFFDVGIAEGHAVCFASGLASQGLRPFVVIYSTFLQRAYDQIIHDAALQKLPVVFCIDRAGLVGEDGPTHHGCFDLSYLSSVPNMTVMAPRDGDELRAMLHEAARRPLRGPCAIRYPRSSIPVPMKNKLERIEWGRWHQLRFMGDTVLIAVGAMVDTALKVHDILKDEIDISVINARFVKPLDCRLLDECAAGFRNIITLEENSFSGGIGQKISSYLTTNGFRGRFMSLAIPDKFIAHGRRADLLAEMGLDAESVAARIREFSVADGFFRGGLSLKKGHVGKIAAVFGGRKSRESS